MGKELVVVMLVNTWEGVNRFIICDNDERANELVDKYEAMQMRFAMLQDRKEDLTEEEKMEFDELEDEVWYDAVYVEYGVYLDEKFGIKE